MGYCRGLGDAQDVLRAIARVADTVGTTARVAGGAAPAVSAAQRFKWPLVIGGSAALGGIVAYFLTRRRGRRS